MDQRAGEKHPIDDRAYNWAAFTLRGGMAVSFAAMVAGLIWWLVAGATSGVGSTAPAIPIERTAPELFSGNPLALLSLGVLALLVTPGISVVVILVSYLLDRNRRFAVIAALVLAILVVSLALSLNWLRLF